MNNAGFFNHKHVVMCLREKIRIGFFTSALSQLFVYPRCHKRTQYIACRNTTIRLYPLVLAET